MMQSNSETARQPIMKLPASTASCISAICWLMLVSLVHAQASEEVQMLKTPSGIRFAKVGQKGDQPKPTLFVFAMSARGTLHDDDYFKSGRVLSRKGWLCVSLDAPCHDEDVRTGEPSALLGWRARLDKHENLMSPFVEKSRAVLDYLVEAGYTDPQRVAVAGISRGGLCAFHFAAEEPRAKWVMTFAPVTDLPVLEEFKDLENDPTTKSLAATNLVKKLVGRQIWICIGNNDERVGTDQCFAFVREVAQANLAEGKPANIELHVMPSGGHTIHATAHDDAAAWLVQQTK